MLYPVRPRASDRLAAVDRLAVAGFFLASGLVAKASVPRLRRKASIRLITLRCDGLAGEGGQFGALFLS